MKRKNGNARYTVEEMWSAAQVLLYLDRDLGWPGRGDHAERKSGFMAAPGRFRALEHRMHHAYLL